MATRNTTLAMRESRNTMPVPMPRKNNGPLARSLIHSLNGMVITRHDDRVDASAMASSESAKDLIAQLPLTAFSHLLRWTGRALRS